MECTCLDDLSKLCKIPCTTFPLDGMQLGVSVRFRTFYLKIYHEGVMPRDYHVFGYFYDTDTPVIERSMSWSDLKRMMRSIRSENYLYAQIIPCHCECDEHRKKIW